MSEEHREISGWRKVLKKVRLFLKRQIEKTPSVLFKVAEGREFHLPLKLEREYQRSSYSLFQNYITTQIVFAILLFTFVYDILIFSEFIETPVPTTFGRRIIFIVFPFLDFLILFCVIPCYYLQWSMVGYVVKLFSILYINFSLLVRMSFMGTSQASMWNIILYFMLQAFLYMDWKTYFLVFVVAQCIVFGIYEIITNVEDGKYGAILIQLSLVLILSFAGLRTAHFLQKQRRILFLRHYDIRLCHDILERHKNKNKVLYKILLPKDIYEVVSRKTTDFKYFLDSKYSQIPFVCAKICNFQGMEMFLSAKDLISVIHKVFVTFDEELEKLEFCHRFKTLNHQYMFITGCPGKGPEGFDPDIPAQIEKKRRNSMKKDEDGYFPELEEEEEEESNNCFYYAVHLCVELMNRMKESDFGERGLMIGKVKISFALDVSKTCYSCVVGKKMQWDVFAENLASYLSSKNDISDTILMRRDVLDHYDKSELLRFGNGFQVEGSYGKLDLVLIDDFDDRIHNIGRKRYTKDYIILEQALNIRVQEIAKARTAIRTLSSSLKELKQERDDHNKLLKIVKHQKKSGKQKSIKDLVVKFQRRKEKNEEKRKQRESRQMVELMSPDSDDDPIEEEKELIRQFSMKDVKNGLNDHNNNNNNDNDNSNDNSNSNSNSNNSYNSNENENNDDVDENENEEEENEGEEESVDINDNNNNSNNNNNNNNQEEVIEIRETRERMNEIDDEDEEEGESSESLSGMSSMSRDGDEVDLASEFKNLDDQTYRDDEMTNYDDDLVSENLPMEGDNYDEEHIEAEKLFSKRDELDSQIAQKKEELKKNKEQRKLKEKEEREKERKRDAQIAIIIKKEENKNKFDLYEYVEKSKGKIRQETTVRGQEIESRLDGRWDYQVDDTTKLLDQSHLVYNFLTFCCPFSKIVSPICCCYQCFPPFPEFLYFWNCCQRLDEKYIKLNILTFKNMFKKYYKQTRITIILWCLGFIFGVYLDVLKQVFKDENRKDFGWFFPDYSVWDVMFYKTLAFVPPLIVSNFLCLTSVFTSSWYSNFGLTIISLLGTSGVFLANFYLFETYETGISIYLLIFFHLSIEGLPALVRSFILGIVVLVWIILACVQYSQARNLDWSIGRPEPTYLVLHILAVILAWYFFLQRSIYRQLRHFEEYFIEALAKKKLQTLNIVKDKSSDLLASLLSEGYMLRMHELVDVNSVSKFYEDVAVMVVNLCNTKEYLDSLKHDPEKVCENLNVIYSHLDSLTDDPRLWRVKSVRGCYIVAAGVPNVSRNAAQQIAICALEMIKWLESTKQHAEFRIGIHTGPVFSGLVMRDRFQLDIFGKTIDIAVEFEEKGKPMMIHVSYEFTRAYCHHGNQKKYRFARRRGVVQITQRRIETYWIVQREEGKKK